MRLRRNAETHRPFPKTERALQLEALLEHDCATLLDCDGRGRELDIGQAGGPVRVRATGFNGRRRWRRLGCHARGQVAVLDFRRRDRD